jgi:2-polyprenyl-6-hydroxyphenyl methylase/3-demethylubiquinone-9 3-methyltransferase
VENKKPIVDKGGIRWRIAQWFELRWWHSYFRGKDKTNYYRWKRQYWNNLITQIADVLPLAAAHSIADLGCGPAGIFTIFEGKEVTALDPLLDSYATTLPFFDRADFPYTTFLNLPLEDYQPTTPHHITFCMNAINHVADIDRAYDSLINATQQGGYVVVSIDAHNHSFFKLLFRLLPGDILHPHQYDLAEYEHFLTHRHCTLLKTILIKKEFFFSHYVQVAKR